MRNGEARNLGMRDKKNKVKLDVAGRLNSSSVTTFGATRQGFKAAPSIVRLVAVLCGKAE